MNLPKSIAERAENFWGRGWVFQEIDDWLAQDPGDRYFLITGEPGSGKTAIAARLFQFSAGEAAPNGYAHLHPNSIGAAHFCMAADAASIDPRSFAASLALQLSARSQAYAQALKSVGDKVININVQATSQKLENFTGVVIQNLDVSRISAQDAFNRLVIDPLLAAQEPFTILVDSLDEALRHSADINIVKLLSNVGSLPGGVRFILTSRVESRVESRFPGAEGTSLSAVEHGRQNHDDIEQLARDRLKAAGLTAADLPGLIAEKSEGNFQYANFVVKALAAGQMEVSSLDGLPPGLDAIYHESLTRVVDLGGKSWAADYAPTMGVLSVVQERSTVDDLRTFSAQTETATWNCIGDLQQFIESDDAADPRYSLYHHSVTEFFQRRQLRFGNKTAPNNFYLPPAEWHRRMAAKYIGQPPLNWDLYGLRYTATHLAQAVRASSGAERHEATQCLVRLTNDVAFHSAHLSRIGDLPQLQRDLAQAVQCAARNSVPEGLELIVESALSLVQFRRKELRPEPLFDLAAHADPASVAARLALFDVDPEWHQIASMVVAWLAADYRRAEAIALRDRVASMAPLSTRAARLIEFFDAWIGAKPAPAREPLPQALPPDVVRAIVERMGGSGSGATTELLSSYNIPDVRNPSLLASEGYLSQHGGPYLVAFAQADRAAGDEFLREYIEIHTGYQYVQYRNRSLGFLLDAVCNHSDPQWIRSEAVKIATSALAGSRSDFQQALPTAVLAVRAKADSVARTRIDSMLQDAVSSTTQLLSGRTSDPLSLSKRQLAVMIEALSYMDRRAEALLLMNNALAILRTGFAGYSAPACVTIAEALEIAHRLTPSPAPMVLDAALSAAHNVQDPLFSARVTSRVQAMREFYWDLPFELSATVNRFIKDPEAAEFCPTFRIGEAFEYRSPDSLPMDPRFHSANTIEKIEKLFKLRPDQAAALNPGVQPNSVLPDGFRVRLPDPGFASWLAARFAGRASADPAVTADQRIAIIRSLVPLAAASPTTLDTVMSRLVLAEQPAAVQALDRIAALADAAVVERGSLAARLPDAAIPA